MAMDGQWERGMEWLRRGMQLNPRYPEWHNNISSIDAYLKRDYEAALAEIRKVTTHNFFSPMIWAMVAGQMGDQDESTAAMQSFREMHGDISAEEMLLYLAAWLHRAEDMAHLEEGFRMAVSAEQTQ